MTHEEQQEQWRERFPLEDEAEAARLRREASASVQRVAHAERRIREYGASEIIAQRNAEKEEDTQRGAFHFVARRAIARDFTSETELVAFAIAEGRAHVGALTPAQRSRLESAGHSLWQLLAHIGEVAAPLARRVA